jgi:hypothetical protein
VVARAFVVIGKSVVRRAYLALTGCNCDQLEPRVLLTTGLVPRVERGRAAKTVEMGKLERLQHRFAVLLLVADDEFMDIARAAIGRYLEYPLAHLGEIFARLRTSQERQFPAAGSRGLKRVVHLGQVLAQQRQTAEAMGQPQVLKRGDVPQIPDQRAHQRGMNLLKILVRDRRDEIDCPLPGLSERVDDFGRHLY